MKRFSEVLRHRWLVIAGLLAVALAALAIWSLGSGRVPADAELQESGEAAAGASLDSVVALDSTSLRLADISLITVGNGGAAGLTVNGTIAYDANRVSLIAPRADSRVVQVRADLGHHVRAGTALATLSSAEIGRTQGELEEARARLEVTLQNYDREKRLYEQSISSQKEVIEAEGEYRSAQASYNSAMSQLRAFGALAGEGGNYALVSPITGIVVERNATPGQIAGPETNLFTVADLRHLWITADVYEGDLSRVSDGAAVAVSAQALPGRVFAGRVTYAGGVVDPESRTFKVRVVVENPQLLLRPGMFAQVTIATGAETSASETIVIPELAIQDLDGHSVVFVAMAPGRFVARRVTLGARTGEGRRAVLDGLRADEQVVLNGAFRLKAELTKGSFGADED